MITPIRCTSNCSGGQIIIACNRKRWEHGAECNVCGLLYSLSKIREILVKNYGYTQNFHAQLVEPIQEQEQKQEGG